MLNYIPCCPGEKRPLVNWKQYQTKLYNGDLPKERGIVCGRISGGLEVLDFDDNGSRFNAWSEKVKKVNPALYDKLVIEQTPSGGYHVYFLYQFPEGDQKLARKEDNSVLIETRGEGGFIKCSPSNNYVIKQRSLQELDLDDNASELITEEERALLFAAARSFDLASATTPKQAKQVKPAASTYDNAEFNADSLHAPQYRYLIQEHLAALGFICINEAKGYYGSKYASNPNENKIELHQDNSVYTYAACNIGGLEPDKNYTPLQFLAFCLHTSEGDAFHQLERLLGKNKESVKPTAEERAETEAADIDTSAPTLRSEVIEQLPPILLSFMEHINDKAASPQRVCSMLCYLAIFAHFLNGKIKIGKGQYAGIVPSVNFNTLMISETGSGKDFIQRYFANLVYETKHAADGYNAEFGAFDPDAPQIGEQKDPKEEEEKDIVLTNCSSAQYLQIKLAQTNGDAVLLFDEVKDLLTKRNKVLDTFLGLLKSTLEKPYNERINLAEGKGQDKYFKQEKLIKRTERCNVTALFFAPGDFARCVTREDIEGGLTGRFCVILGEPRAKVLKFKIGVQNDATPRNIDIFALSGLDTAPSVSYEYTNDDDKASEYLRKLASGTESEDATCRLGARLWGLASVIAYLRAFSANPLQDARIPWQGVITCNSNDFSIAYEILDYCKRCINSILPEVVDASLAPCDRAIKLTQTQITRAIGQLTSKKLRGAQALKTVPDLQFLLNKRPSILRNTTFTGAVNALQELYKLGKVDFDIDREDHLPRNIFLKKQK